MGSKGTRVYSNSLKPAKDGSVVNIEPSPVKSQVLFIRASKAHIFRTICSLKTFLPALISDKKDLPISNCLAKSLSCIPTTGKFNLKF